MPLILLVPAILAAVGLYSGRDGLVWLAVGLFVWLSWDRKQKERRRARLFSVPMPTDVRVPEFGGGPVVTSEATNGGRCEGCA
jgi:hypothetical protein